MVTKGHAYLNKHDSILLKKNVINCKGLFPQKKRTLVNGESFFPQNVKILQLG